MSMHTVTYSPEDNKLRLYVGRVPRDEYERLRAAGFVSTPKQDCDFVATWTPQREDIASEYLEDGEDIGDEDYSPEERAADRAERFEGYRDKRRDEAGGMADRFEGGPGAFGHQNRGKAERQAARHDRLRVKSVSQWSKAEYWQRRTAGVIAHALHKSSASVRRGRILTLEAEQRKFSNRWSGQEMSEHAKRWHDHYELRLGYERAMLAQEGGSASEVEMEPGGFVRGVQIDRVNRSPVTGRVVSVKVGRRSVNIERLGAGDYRAPTDEERAAFIAATKERKAKEKAEKPAAIPLINPTEEDAERLQAIWNAEARQRHENRKSYGEYKPSAVVRMTQAEYSARSKGSYAVCCTAEISEQLKVRWSNAMGRDKAGRVTIFKIRKTGSGGFNSSADRVIVITDKPQSSIPWETVEKAKAKQPTREKLFYRLEEIQAIAGLAWLPNDNDEPEKKQLLNDAHYVGWVYIDSLTQFGFTEAGHEAWRKFQEIKAEGGIPEENGIAYPLSVCVKGRHI